ncbi:aminotransferase class I/II-fold pyridoxal phosphate-dependent enzyme, partial [Marinomonas sp.]
HTNRLAQLMVGHFLESGQYPNHIATLKVAYKKKRDAMADALIKHLNDEIEFSLPAGGMFFWVKLPEGVPSMKVLEMALQKQVLVLPGKPFFPTNSSLSDAYLRLSFARVSLVEMDKAIQTLSAVIKRLANRAS